MRSAARASRGLLRLPECVMDRPPSLVSPGAGRTFSRSRPTAIPTCASPEGTEEVRWWIHKPRVCVD